MQSAYKLNYALNSLVVVTHGSFRPIQIIKCGGFHSRANFAFGKIFLNDIIKVSESFFDGTIRYRFTGYLGEVKV